MIDPEVVAKEFYSEVTDGKSVWIAFKEGGYLAYPEEGISVIPLWSTQGLCSEYIQDKYGDAGMNAVEVPLEVFISVWIKEADEKGWEYCLNKTTRKKATWLCIHQNLGTRYVTKITKKSNCPKTASKATQLSFTKNPRQFEQYYYAQSA